MSKQNRKPVIGVVGGIGSGKSEVARILARHGAWLINADHLGHEALEQTDIKTALLERWGEKVCHDNGDIDRKKVAAIVFNNTDELHALQDIVFPYIGNRIAEEIDKGNAEDDSQFIVLDAAIMLETGWAAKCDWVVFVHTPKHIRYQRLQQHRGWNEKEVQQRRKAQMSLTEKVSRANFVVDNSSDLEHVARQVESLLRTLGLLQN